MSIDNITAKIVSDATEYAEELISAAKQEAAEITAQALKEADSIRVLMSERASKDAASVKHRKNSVAELEARKMRLSAKQAAVANVVVAAIDHLADMKPEQYIAFLVGKIAEIGMKDGQIVLNAKDKAAVGEDLVKAANKALDGGNLTLSEQTINMKGGFVLKHGALEINSGLETMVNALKEGATPEIVAVLFQNHEDKYEKV
ncbi:MAG: V-type ATP synthase subunit E [Clostridiales bacterium]|nr:V-type ATP synthase subunit E [Clostridiales bacterium]